MIDFGAPFSVAYPWWDYHTWLGYPLVCLGGFYFEAVDLPFFAAAYIVLLNYADYLH